MSFFSTIQTVCDVCLSSSIKTVQSLSQTAFSRQTIREQLRLLHKELQKRLLYTHFVIYLESKRETHEAEDRALQMGESSEKTEFL